MGVAHSAGPAKLFCAVLFKDDADLEKVLDSLQKRFGPVDHRFGPVSFHHSRYYQKEMGSRLRKLYLSFARTVARDKIASIKEFTNGLEQKYLHEGKRRVNLDPGYLTRDKLVLATTKDFFQRVYLRKGIYAEVTLHFRRGRYRYFSWTYPDYREPALCLFLQKVRARLVKELGLRSASADSPQ